MWPEQQKTRPVAALKRDAQVVATLLHGLLADVEPEGACCPGERGDRRGLLTRRVLPVRPHQRARQLDQLVLVDLVQHGPLGGGHGHAGQPFVS